MKFNFSHKNIGIDVKVCNGVERFFGLMFTQRKKAKALLFDFQKPTRLSIHSWFVFFSFFAIWLDDKNNVIQIKKIKPFGFPVCPKKPFYKIVEIPINEEYEKVIGRIF